MASARRRMVAYIAISMGLYMGGWQAAFAEEFRKADVDAVIERLSSRNEQDRWSAADHIRDMGPYARAGIPKLIEIVANDPSSSVRFEAARSLGEMGTDAKAAVPALIAFYHNRRMGTDRTTAIEALGTVDPTSREALQTIMDALRDEDDYYFRLYAVLGLKNFGTFAKEAAPLLIDVINGPASETLSLDLRTRAEQALIAVGGRAEDIPALIALTEDELDSTKAAGAGTLGTMGPDAAPAVPNLITLLSDRSDTVQLAAATALGNIGPAAKEAIPALKHCRSNKSVHDAAVKAIREIEKSR